MDHGPESFRVNCIDRFASTRSHHLRKHAMETGSIRCRSLGFWGLGNMCWPFFWYPLGPRISTYELCVGGAGGGGGGAEALLA